VIIDGTNVAGAQGHECLSQAGESDELDLDSGRSIDLHDGSQIALAEAVLRKVSSQDHPIELTVRHDTSGYAVTDRGTASPVRTIHIVVIASDLSCGPRRIILDETQLGARKVAG
jgi:hypothetical protein